MIELTLWITASTFFPAFQIYAGMHFETTNLITLTIQICSIILVRVAINALLLTFLLTQDQPRNLDWLKLWFSKIGNGVCYFWQNFFCRMLAKTIIVHLFNVSFLPPDSCILPNVTNTVPNNGKLWLQPVLIPRLLWTSILFSILFILISIHFTPN